MNVSEALAAALASTDQAIATTRDATDELKKLSLGSRTDQPGKQALAKMSDQLGIIRKGLAILEAYHNAQPQHPRVQ